MKPGARRAIECINLHRVAVALFVLGLATSAAAQSQAPDHLGFDRLLTATERDRFQLELAALVVEVVRDLPLARHYSGPRPLPLRGVAFCLSPGRFVTASEIVRDFPLPAGREPDALILRGVDGRAVPTTVRATVIVRSPELGLAILQTSEPLVLPCGRLRLPPAGGTVSASTDPQRRGRTLMAAVPGIGLTPTVVLGDRGPGVRSYFTLAAGDALPPGTPLVDPNFNLIGIVADVEHAQPGLSYIVPTRGLREFFASNVSPPEAGRGP